MAEEVDLIVVGAGAAGIGAGLAARAAGGIEFRILEAKDRVGGRAHTVEEKGAVYDLGCHFLHSASRNPFSLTALGGGDPLSIRRTTKTFPQALFRNGSRLPETDRAACSAYYRACAEAEHSAPDDVPASDVIDTASPYYDFYTAWCAAISGIPPERASTADLQAYGDTGEDWPVRSGYGKLIAGFAEGLPITFGCPVSAIDRSGGRIAVETPQGTLSAKAVVVTVSTGVLTAGAIRFAPDLPPQVGQALADVPMGYAERVALVTDRHVIDEIPLISHVVPGSGRALGLLFHEYGANTIGGYIAGDLALDLAREGGAAALIDYTEAAAVEIMGSDLRKRIVGRTGSCWSTDPHILGGYSAALPGRGTARSVLAERFDERLILAGEATSTDTYSTAHGAYITGVNAVARLAMEGVL